MAAPVVIDPIGDLVVSDDFPAERANRLTTKVQEVPGDLKNLQLLKPIRWLL